MASRSGHAYGKGNGTGGPFTRWEIMMKRPILLLALAASTMLLAGCTPGAYVSPTEVTRFAVPDAPLSQGSIRVEPAPGMDPESIEYGLYAAEVAGELGSHGYLVVEGEADQVAEVNLEQWVERQARRSPVSVGGGAGIGSHGSGVGLGIGIDLSGPPPERIDTLLTVSIRPAEGGSNLWEGRARFTASGNSEYADPAAASDRAARALFTDFPGTSGETITVE